MKRMRLGGWVALVISLAVPALVAAKVTILASGSTSIFPLASQLGSKYKQVTHGKVALKVLQGSSDVGIDDVAHGRVAIGDVSREPILGSGGDPHGLFFNRIARDAVCVVTNAKNPLGGLSQATVQNIFSGRVRDWSKVPGAKVKGPIDLITRVASSGTQDAFQNIFMGLSLKVSGAAAEKPSNGRVQSAVRSDPEAIGYVSLDFTTGLYPASYKGVGCTLRNAKSGQYPGTRNFYMVTRGKPTGVVKTFLKWVRTSAAARRIINTHWVPAP